MTDIESLTEAIVQYEEQLSQVEIALSLASDGLDKENLVSLRSDIQELIDLTKESLRRAKTSNSNKEATDPLADEYELFKVALDGNLAEDKSGKNDGENETTTEEAATSVDIEEELKALEGTKCRAPHGSTWGCVGHHNAMVCSVDSADNDPQVRSMNDIKVRVMFTNPTHREMLPCPYYLEGECKFSDDQCHYSHGEVVSLSSLQEYRKPDFSSVKLGSRVLAKQQKSKLWHRAVVSYIPEIKEDLYRVKFEASGTILELGLHDLLPLDDADLDMSNSSDDSESDNDTETLDRENVVQQSLLGINGNEALGSWERYTRGMGSKLMASMGYITGTGLGKRADGRVEPVEATVLPAGKSLDHCMGLRENSGGDKDLFSVERRLKRQERKMNKMRERQYEREKRRERNNIFNFINSTIGDKTEDEVKPGSSTDKTDLKTKTSQKLNIASLQVGESIRRLEKEATKLHESLSRHGKGTLPYNAIVSQYNQKQKELVDLRLTEKNISAEQNHRKSKAKLTIF